MDLGLTGKVALITGASRGLGEAIAGEPAREGVDVCLVARDETRLSAVADAIAAQSQAETLVYAGDFRDPGVPKDAVARCVARFGRLDILVNNAGATKRGDFLTLNDEDWQDGFALKFHGYVRATRAAWPHLRETRGNIINIASIGARAGPTVAGILKLISICLRTIDSPPNLPSSRLSRRLCDRGCRPAQPA